MRKVVYLKKVQDYNDVLKREYRFIPLILKKIIYLYKNFFNIITRKVIDGNYIIVLPIKENNNEKKINNILNKTAKDSRNIYVVQECIKNKEFIKIMENKQIPYITGERLKKILLIKALEYIANMKKKKTSSMDLTILANQASEINLYIIEKLAHMAKSIKIVSGNLYHFKKLEDELYEKYGIAIQFSNSYKKSLTKSEIIINLDFNEIDINEYVIYNHAVIINCVKKDLKLKARLFNGIIINNYKIKFSKQIQEILKHQKLYKEYDNLELYESIYYNEKDISYILKQIDNDEVEIKNAIGNNGIIHKKEFENMYNIT